MPHTAKNTTANPAAPEWARGAQWHPSVHWDWYDHELFFWMFGFEASYDPAELLDVIERSLARLGHTSYTCYELIGSYDLIIRIWMPPGDVRALDREFRAVLRPKGMRHSQRFSVQRIVRHWVWASNRNGTGKMKWPASEILDAGRPERELSIVDGRHSEHGIADVRLLKRYRRDRLVAPAQSRPGIKLVLTITPAKPLDDDTKIQMRAKLAELLDRSGGLISERSLYYGDGQAVLFLVMCRVPFHNFHLIRSKLIARIAEALGLVEVRITTHAVTSSGALRFRDTLPRHAVAVVESPDIEDLLQDGESARVEFKGSAFSPLNDWLNHGKELREEEGFAVRTILKSIGSFLNSGGGILVIGVLEEKNFPGAAAAQRLAPYPSVNSFICVGLREPTFAKRGWDAFATRLEQLIRARIQPDPADRVTLQKVEYKGHSLCIVTVDDDPLETSSFFIRAKGKPPALYVRRGAITRLLEGPDIERHAQRRKQAKKESK
jgi:hypothetical protein